MTLLKSKNEQFLYFKKDVQDIFSLYGVDNDDDDDDDIRFRFIQTLS